MKIEMYMKRERACPHKRAVLMLVLDQSAYLHINRKKYVWLWAGKELMGRMTVLGNFKQFHTHARAQNCYRCNVCMNQRT